MDLGGERIASGRRVIKSRPTRSTDLIAQVGREDGKVEERRHDADDQVGWVDPEEDQRLDHALVTPLCQSTASAAESA